MAKRLTEEEKMQRKVDKYNLHNYSGWFKTADGDWWLLKKGQVVKVSDEKDDSY